MSRVIKSLRNLEIAGRLDLSSKSSSRLEDDDQQQQATAAADGAGKSSSLLSRLKPGKQKSYESLMDAGSPTEERPQQQQSSWATFDDCTNLIDLSSPLPPQPMPTQIQPALFIDVSAPPDEQEQQRQQQQPKPIIIRSDNGAAKHSTSLEGLNVQTAGGQAIFNPSFRKESPKAKAAPAPPPSRSSTANSARTPPPRPGQPPPRPSQPPKITTSASSNALLLLDLDFGQPQQQQQPVTKSRKAPAPPPPSQRRQPQQQALPTPSFAASQLSPGAVCLAKFDLANTPDPGILTLQRGDRLIIVRQEDDNWMVARRLSGDEREGLVACSYLELADNSTAPEPADDSIGIARALHDYRSDHSGDLSFSTGQLIVKIRQVDSDWLEGQLASSGQRGLFPANHAQLILYTATAKHAFPAQQAGDLALEVGDEVDIQSELPGGEWLQGRRVRDGADGTFPAAFIVRFDAAAASTGVGVASQGKPTARAIYDFSGREVDELSLQAGDLLTDLVEQGPDWMAGVAVADGRRGIFPRAFVEML